MPITERPVSFNSAEIEDTNIKQVVFSYDFPDYKPIYHHQNDLQHKNFVEEHMNIKGVGFNISSALKMVFSGFLI